MSDADFARFAQASMSAQAQQTVLVGETTGQKPDGMPYTIVVYVVRDGFPETTYTFFVNQEGKIISVQ